MFLFTDKPSPAVVSEAKKKATLLEDNLKAANLSNQAERKRLAAAHSSLLSQHLSQEELNQGSQPLKAQLLQLATRQKQLLECFKKQKEMNLMLTKLEETTKTVSTGHSNPSQALASVGVSTVDRTEAKSCLSAGVQVMKGHVVPTPSTLAAALPNLVRHLRQPVGEREETRLQSQPKVTINASKPSQTTGTSTHNQFTDVSAASIISSHSRPSHSSMHQPQTTLPSNSQSMTSKSSSVHVPSVNKQLSDSGGNAGGGVNSSGVAAAKIPLSSTDLSQPVPLPDLIKQGFIKPGVDRISCLIMVKQASLILVLIIREGLFTGCIRHCV